MTDYELGHIASVPVGSVFHSRKEVREAGLHRHLINGIDGDEHVTRSIVAAGIYSDDSDYGVTLWYAGQGGFDRDTGLQIDHQRFEGPNAGLAASMASGLAIRLIRGWGPRKEQKFTVMTASIESQDTGWMKRKNSISACISWTQ